MSPRLHRSSSARANHGSYCSAFPTPCNRAEEAAEHSSSADGLSRASSTRGAGLLVVAGLKLIGLAAGGYADQLHFQLRTAAHVPGACGLHQSNARVGTTRYDGAVANHHGRFEGGRELIAGVVLSGVDAVNHANGENGA